MIFSEIDSEVFEEVQLFCQLFEDYFQTVLKI